MNRRSFMATQLALAASAGGTSAAQPSLGDYVALCLDQAARRGRQGHAEALSLAGITRFVGMVQDPAGRIIAVGRRVPGLSALTLDDFVVAYRARQRKDWPTVSIDPDEETQRTRTQCISFVGGIANTAFGRDFLRADVYLKIRSMEIRAQRQAVPSFAHLLGEAERREGQAGAPLDLRWIGAQDGPQGRGALDKLQVREESSQATRFWFFARNPRVLVRDGVFCIDELRVGVQEEEVAEQGVPASKPPSKAASEAAAAFARAVETHLRPLAAEEPALLRIKGLYDLVAMAEGILRLKSRSNLDDLIAHHEVTPVPTPSRHELLQVVGLLGREGNVSRVITVCGGISFEAQLQWMNDGDVSPLREVVLQTRPSADALAWQLPLARWKMPNSHDLPAGGGTRPGDSVPVSKGKGFVLSSRSLAVVPGIAPGIGTGADTLAAPRPVAGLQPIGTRVNYVDPVGGVTMEISDWNVTPDRSGRLQGLRQQVLGSRPASGADGALSWPGR